MPIRVVQRSSKRLSKQYYRYGHLIASKTTLLFIFSLFFITYFSLPVIKKQLSIPTTHYTLLDGQCWQNSPHVQFDNSTSSNYIIQQIRLSHIDRPITFDLVQKAHKIYSSIAGNESLFQICYQKDDQCLAQAPPLFRDEQDWRQKSRYTHVLKYESHPFSIYANVSFNQQGDYIKSDAILLSFLLKHQPETFSIWNDILDRIQKDMSSIDVQYEPRKEGHWYRATVDATSHTIQYKFKLFPYDIPPKAQLFVSAYIIGFYLVSVAFGRSNLVKSGYTFGLAAIFLSTACFTTTWGITDKLGIQLNNVPWPLLLLTVNIACLENMFLITWAVLDAGCDMIVKEKISRGLQSVGLPMTTTLVAELMILTVGTAMDVAMIKEFCWFIKVALVVDYILEMTFVIAVLSSDIKRLADLDDRQMSKRLHEIGNRDTDINQQTPDLCPIQDTANEESKSCAECKDFKTHRVFNALTLCFIVLGLSLFTKKEKSLHITKRIASPQLINNTTKTYIPDYQSDVYRLSEKFWSIVNPEKESVWIQVEPPLLFIYDYTTHVEPYVNKVRDYYHKKSLEIHYKPSATPSLFRLFIHSTVQRIIVFLLGINIPVLILWLCLIGIITWMTPKWRNQWLVPLLIRAFNKSVLAILGFVRSAREFYRTCVKDIRNRYEHDADGLHRGAIATQAIFNREHSHIKGVRIQTLTHQHVADIQNLDANTKGSLVSCGQDGRLVLWDTAKAIWVARLDKLCLQGRIAEQATMNSEHRIPVKRGKRPSQPSAERLPKPLRMKVDRGNKWIATSHDDQSIRVWNLLDGALLNKLTIDSPIQSEGPQTMRHRFQSTETVHQYSDDRILDIQFINSANSCHHPSIASHAETNQSQDSLLSVHKSGLVREWNIMTGECVQTIETGHTRPVTQLHVAGAKDSHHPLDATWMFTASRDGTVRCFERRLQGWTLVYTVEQHSPITSIATEMPVGGMGLLVSGSLDGTVKVWNFETGELLHTLSEGKAELSKQKDTGGPIRHFSNFNDEASDLSDTDSMELHAEDKGNHRGAIRQIAVTRYCETENGFCSCGGYDVCFGNGFLVASIGSENHVHAWRLEHKGVHEGSHTLLPRDYHRKQYRRHKLDEGAELNTKRTRSPSIPKKITNRYTVRSSKSNIPGVVDIEQVADPLHISLSPVFLGRIDQPAGHGLVFCDKILAGVRRMKGQRMEWEAWFAPLQYCDPATRNNMQIPVETFSLDQSEDAELNKQSKFSRLFGPAMADTTRSVTKPSSSFRHKGTPRLNTNDSIENDEAGENLPFSTIRHVIALDGYGLACDYGNFIKLVYIERPSLAEKEIHRQAQILLEEEKSIDEECRCPPDRRGKEGCCSGAGYREKKARTVKYNKCALRHKCSRAANCAAVASS